MYYCKDENGVNKQDEKLVTLNVIILNNEISSPEADTTYESFLDNAMQWTASSRFASLITFAINIPLVGCRNWGMTLVVA